MKTIRLIYPQQQGGNISRWIPELSPEDASRGYLLGSMLLEFLGSITANHIFKVPVSDNFSQRVENG